jgi:hypothetical protein
MPSPEIRRRVDLPITMALEERIASISKVKRISKLRKSEGASYCYDSFRSDDGSDNSSETSVQQEPYAVTYQATEFFNPFSNSNP